jgi:hypothetical protein
MTGIRVAHKSNRHHHLTTFLVAGAVCSLATTFMKTGHGSGNRQHRRHGLVIRKEPGLVVSPS